MILESIKNLGVIDIAETNIGQTSATISYPEYELVGPVSAFDKVPDELAISSNLFLNPLDTDPVTVEMKMVAKHKLIELKEETIMLPDDRDPGDYIKEKILENVLKNILALSCKHRDELGSLKDGKPFDIDFTSTGERFDDISIARKIFYKILSCANSIATSGRRGPADVVLASRKMINAFNIIQSPSGFMFVPSYNVSNLKLVACDALGDTIVVMRRESGLVLCSREELLPIKYLFNEEGTDVKAAVVMYDVADVGTRVHYNYLCFDVKCKL